MPPALRGSARPPASIGPPGLEAGARAARVLPGGKSGGGGCSPKVSASEPAGKLPDRAASERGGKRAWRRGGRGAPRANQRAERAEGASEGRQAVRSSFESNCLSQEEMWHLIQGEQRGKGPSGSGTGTSLTLPRAKLPEANSDRPLPVSGLTSAARGDQYVLRCGNYFPIIPREQRPSYSLGVMGNPHPGPGH